MIDYITMTRAVSRVMTTLTSTAATADPNKVKELKLGLDNINLFTLGTFYLHLFEHSGPSQKELAHLESASIIWKDVQFFYKRVGDIRAKAEQLPLTPESPDKYNILQSVLRESKELEAISKNLTDAAQQLLDKLRPTDYLDTHPLSTGTSPQDWSWYELLIARRTGAFVANLSKAALNNDDARAFAQGAMLAYATHSIGSSYLNDVVGGARRSHPYRHKLARNTIGAWHLAHGPNETLSLTELHGKIAHVRNKAEQVSLINNLIKDALTATYPQLTSKPMPDIGNAIANMAHHLKLLTSFQPLTLPALTPILVQREIESSGARATSEGELKPKTFSEPYVAPAGEFTSNNPVKDNEWYDWVFILCQAILWIMGKFVEVVRWIEVKLGIIEPGSPFVASQTQAVVTSKEYYVLLSVLASLQNELYQRCADALTAIKLLGIIYPDDSDLALPPFNTLTSLQVKEPAFHLPVAPSIKYLGYPETEIEQPHSLHSVFHVGDNPDAIFQAPSSLDPSATSFALALLLGTVKSTINPEKVNLNLDADRGFLDKCWELKSPPSVSPMDISPLNYDEI